MKPAAQFAPSTAAAARRTGITGPVRRPASNANLVCGAASIAYGAWLVSPVMVADMARVPLSGIEDAQRKIEVVPQAIQFAVENPGVIE